MFQTDDQRTLRLPATPASDPPTPQPHHESTRAEPSPRRRGMALVAAGLALTAVIGGTWLAHTTDTAEYQPVASAGADPFTTPVGTDAPGLTSLLAGGTRAAGTPELYAQDPERPSCDAGALVTQLSADSAKAAAWSQVQRITPAVLPTYVQTLTPVLLRADTAVTDHGYRDGTFVPAPAVLAAGTAVFVNSYGQPTVKCFSGDPLTPGASSDPEVTAIAPAPTPIATHVFHHPGGGPVTQPGKPDITGTGPVPTDTPARADRASGVSPASTEPLIGIFNYDGSVTLSDGRRVTPDGTVTTLPQRPAGSIRLNDGGWIDTSGLYHNQDGSLRRELYVELPGGEAVTLTADGRYTSLGHEVPLPVGYTLFRNYDGSVTGLYEGSDFAETMVVNSDGTRGPAVYAPHGSRFDNGAIVMPGGQIINPSGTPRREVTLPGGGRVEVDGKNVPPRRADDPANSGIVPPRYRTPQTAPTTVPIERGPARNTGVVPQEAESDAPANEAPVNEAPAADAPVGTEPGQG